jgi:hypothetical protein
MEKKGREKKYRENKGGKRKVGKIKVATGNRKSREQEGSDKKHREKRSMKTRGVIVIASAWGAEMIAGRKIDRVSI